MGDYLLWTYVLSLVDVKSSQACLNWVQYVLRAQRRAFRQDERISDLQPWRRLLLEEPRILQTSILSVDTSLIFENRFARTAKDFWRNKSIRSLYLAQAGRMRLTLTKLKAGLVMDAHNCAHAASTVRIAFRSLGVASSGSSSGPRVVLWESMWGTVAPMSTCSSMTSATAVWIRDTSSRRGAESGAIVMCLGEERGR